MDSITNIVENLRSLLDVKPKRKRVYVPAPARNKYALRRAEIKRLRFDEKWTLQAIANKYNVSRERIRQIVGNTGSGFKYIHIKKAVKEHPEMTNEGLSSMLNIAESTVRRFRGKVRHAIKGGAAKKGVDIENAVSKVLNKEKISHKQMYHNHPYDILLSNGLRVEVKSAHKLSKPKSQRYPYYNFRTQQRNKDCDFYIFVIVPTMDMFVVPSSEITLGNTHIMHPPTRKQSTKWMQYHNRFDLLK